MDEQQTDKDFHCRHYLPHIENKQFQMITFRLYDSVPREVRESWKIMLESLRTTPRTPTPGTPASSLRKDTDEDRQAARQLLKLIDTYEDAGYGQCFMRDRNIARIVEDTIFYYDKKKYDLAAWCIMPNHVHVLCSMQNGNTLSSVLHSWRSFSSNKINEQLNRRGKVWMNEYFDRFIRNEEHFRKAVEYIHNNPVKAGLSPTPEQYPWSSAHTQRWR